MEQLKNEIREALRDLRVAQRIFNEAAPDYVEVACARLQLAEAKVSALFREYKKKMIELH